MINFRISVTGVRGSAHAANRRPEAGGIGGGPARHVLQPAANAKSVGRSDGHLLLGVAVPDDQLHAAEPETEGCGRGCGRRPPTCRRCAGTQPSPASAAQPGGPAPTRENSSTAAADARPAGTCVPPSLSLFDRSKDFRGLSCDSDNLEGCETS